MKNIILITAIILASSFSCKLAAQTNVMLTVNVFESRDKAYNRIIVIENDKKIEDIELPEFYYKNLESHQIEVNKTILKYRNQGYKIISEIRGTTQITSAFPVMITTYRLEK